MSYMRGVCGVARWDGESNVDMYRRFGMSELSVGIDYIVVEWVKRQYGHVMRMNECNFTKRVHWARTLHVYMGGTVCRAL